MNSFKKSLLIGATVIGLGSVAFAAQGDPAPAKGTERSGGWMHKHDDAKFKERMAKRQAALHDKLKLTANQEPAWQTFIAAVTPGERGKRPDRAEWDKLSAPERMERMLAKSKERQDRMASRLAATKTFYAVLSPEQQKIFNDNVGKGRHHGHHRGH
jgi:Spy/CpxP family protein refolding chaperone